MDQKRTANGEDRRPAAGESETEPAPGEDAATESVPATVEETLRSEVQRLTTEAERNWQQFLRAAADLENYRKLAARQRDEAVTNARRGLLLVILSVVDTLERAMAHADAAPDAGGGAAVAIADGLRLAHRQVLDTLKTLNVRPMETVGTPFDPRRHEAVEAVAAEAGRPAGLIVDEIQRGYMMGDEILRPARVRVAQ